MQNLISVLIVEDEDIWIGALKMMLKDLGMITADAVKNTEDALLAFKEAIYDVVLIDIQLGGKEGGIELGTIVRNLYKKPFIYITAGHDHDLKKILESNPAAYLQKPVNANSLNIAIKQALAHKPQSHENDEIVKCDTDAFFIKEGTVYKKLFWKDISYIAAGKNYVTVHNVVDSTDHFIRGSLQRITQDLIPKQLQQNFVQVNRAQVVQFSYIKEISNDEVITDGRNFSLSETYAKELKSKMNIV